MLRTASLDNSAASNCATDSDAAVANTSSTSSASSASTGVANAAATADANSTTNAAKNVSADASSSSGSATATEVIHSVVQHLCVCLCRRSTTADPIDRRSLGAPVSIGGVFGLQQLRLDYCGCTTITSNRCGRRWSVDCPVRGQETLEPFGCFAWESNFRNGIVFTLGCVVPERPNRFYADVTTDTAVSVVTLSSSLHARK